ncbi:putative uncharacterized protein ENSP00000383309 [Dioscorea cayenensis subsp. rotundata]|uniref:Uncharacterized protein n=1 Tax=Dioscorea cayennensis subsp. rotundata TaxID=55577 RepID=A0AB40BXD9_DIOCR|nr:putative uncharacterized protein ENSP00000383309 [Dioscorea cayenensis subsp. rotundata]
MKRSAPVQSCDFAPVPPEPSERRYPVNPVLLGHACHSPVPGYVLTRHCTRAVTTGAPPSAARRRCPSRSHGRGAGARHSPSPGTWRARPWHVRLAALEPPGPRSVVGRCCCARGGAARPPVTLVLPGCAHRAPVPGSALTRHCTRAVSNGAPLSAAWRRCPSRPGVLGVRARGAPYRLGHGDKRSCGWLPVSHADLGRGPFPGHPGSAGPCASCPSAHRDGAALTSHYTRAFPNGAPPLAVVRRCPSNRLFARLCIARPSLIGLAH